MAAPGCKPRRHSGNVAAVSGYVMEQAGRGHEVERAGAEGKGSDRRHSERRVAEARKALRVPAARRCCVTQVEGLDARSRAVCPSAADAAHVRSDGVEGEGCPRKDAKILCEQPVVLGRTERGLIKS